MNSEIVEKTKRILDVKNPYGEDSATEYLAFECFCGKGKIIEEHVWGFNDHIVSLECKECLKKYSSYMSFCGNGWYRYEKK